MTERSVSYAYEEWNGSPYNVNNITDTTSNPPDLDDLDLEYDQYKQLETNIDDNIASYVSNANNTTNNNENNNNNIHFNNDNNNIPLSNNKYSDSPDNEKRLASESAKEMQYFTRNSQTVPLYHEHNITEKDYFNHSLREAFTLQSVGAYLLSIFPILKWLPHYNLTWFSQDLIAGITVGCVLVPQSMSYAQLATLPAQYGLYSSFIGAFIYSLFATSKDVCIGPVAVMSLQTAKVVAAVMDKYPEGTIEAPIIATTLALLCGIIATGVGLLRLGFLVELISLNAVAGFMTGSALNIISGQVPALMGYNSKVNTRTATYKVIIETLKHLPDTKLDAVFGLIPLFILYFWKWWCNNMGPKLVDRYYSSDSRANFIWKKFYFYLQACRNGIIIIVFTAISYGITKGVSKDDRRISILGTVPKGLYDVAPIKVPEGLMAKIAPELPASIIVLLLEHIAISKSFGRVNDYKVVPDQELIAIGVTNLVGTFFHAYPATGSFSRSALKAKCNVKTPLSGIFTGCCVILALYCLTGAFFYIPKATLSAVIIHAVSDLVASYHTTWNFYKMNPLDFLCFIVTIFITVFSSIENGIYFAMCWSCALLLFKVAFPAGQFLGYVEIAEVIDGEVVEENIISVESSDEDACIISTDKLEKKIKNNVDNIDRNNRKNDGIKTKAIDGFTYSLSSLSSSNKIKYHTKWVPYEHNYTRELNPEMEIIAPPDGVLVYRMGDSYTYLNASRHYDVIFDEVKKQTRRGQLLHHRKKEDRPWNDPGEWEPPKFLTNLFGRTQNKSGETELEEASRLENGGIIRDERPLLRIICFDFSQVSQVDATALQSLMDLRKAINSYADRQVEFHFAGIISPWIKRGLRNIGFGTVNEKFSDESIIVGHSSYHLARTSGDLENVYDVRAASGTNLPFFHIDIPDFSKWDI